MEGRAAWQRKEVLDYLFFRFRCRNSEEQIKALSQEQKEKLAKEVFSQLHDRITRLMKEHFYHRSEFITKRHDSLDYFTLDEGVKKKKFFEDLSSEDTEEIILLLDEQLSFWRFTKDYKVELAELSIEKDVKAYVSSREFDESAERAAELADEWPGLIDDIYDIYKAKDKELTDHLFSTVDLITRCLERKGGKRKKS